MGFWSFNLFGNDITNDVKDSYLDLLKQNINDEIVESKLLEEYKELFQTDEEPLVWYALADIEWDMGRLSAFVKSKALDFAEEIEGQKNLFENEIQFNKWSNTVQKFCQKIQSPMPSRKVVKPLVEFVRNPWNIGDFYAYRLHTEKAKKNNMYNKYIVFKKIGDAEYYDGKIYSVIEILNNVFESIPSIYDISETAPMPLTLSPEDCGVKLEDYVPSLNWYMCATMIYDRKNDYPSKYFCFVGNIKTKKKDFTINGQVDFFLERNNMEEWIIDFYLSWKTHGKKTGDGSLV